MFQVLCCHWQRCLHHQTMPWWEYIDLTSGLTKRSEDETRIERGQGPDLPRGRGNICPPPTEKLRPPQTDRQSQRDIRNSISSLGKPSKNQIQQPNNVFECVWKKNYWQPYVTTSIDRRTSCKLHLRWQNWFRNAEGISRKTNRKRDSEIDRQNDRQTERETEINVVFTFLYGLG